MRRVVLDEKNDRLHVETPLGIVNISVGLMDTCGRQVESVSVIPNPNDDGKRVVRRGLGNTRLVELKTKKRR